MVDTRCSEFGWHMRFLRLLGCVAALLMPAGNVSAASKQAFIDLFDGAWTGAGTVIDGAVSWQVNCSAIGLSTINRLTIEGVCTVSILSVRIAADIWYHPASERFSGTYIGARVGPARVSGKSRGNAIILGVTWPEPVNGDTKARMMIVNTGDRFRLTLLDNAIPGGPEQVMSDVLLLRK